MTTDNWKPVKRGFQARKKPQQQQQQQQPPDEPFDILMELGRLTSENERLRAELMLARSETQRMRVTVNEQAALIELLTRNKP